MIYALGIGKMSEPVRCYQHRTGPHHPPSCCEDRRMAASHPIVPGVRFKGIPGFLGYCFGDDGFVWTCRWKHRIGGTVPWRRLKMTLWKGRYYYVTLIGPDGKRKYPVARLILTAFVGPRSSDIEACHFPDRDPKNNRLANLVWGTRAVNESHKLIHGTILRGETAVAAKLTEAQVFEIRAAVDAGERVGEVARRYGVSDCTVSSILRGFTWRHLGVSDAVRCPTARKRSSGHLPDDTIREVFRLRVTGLSMAKIGARLGIAYSHINSILHRRCYRHVLIETTLLIEDI